MHDGEKGQGEVTGRRFCAGHKMFPHRPVLQTLLGDALRQNKGIKQSGNRPQEAGVLGSPPLGGGGARLLCGCTDIFPFTQETPVPRHGTERDLRP